MKGPKASTKTEQPSAAWRAMRELRERGYLRNPEHPTDEGATDEVVEIIDYHTQPDQAAIKKLVEAAEVSHAVLSRVLTARKVNLTPGLYDAIEDSRYVTKSALQPFKDSTGGG